MSIQNLFLALLSGALLSLVFLNYEYFFCAWFGFVPLLVATEKASLLRSYLLGLITGLTLFTTGAYWVTDFLSISKGFGGNSGFILALIYWFYSAHSIALAILIFQLLRKHAKTHEFLVFPVVFVLVELTFPMLFPMRLSETQVVFHTALQGIDYAGARGLDAVILLTNIMIFRALYSVTSSTSGVYEYAAWPWFLSLFIVAIWFVYGLKVYPLWQSKIASWETIKVGLVQVNEVPRLGKKVYYPGYSQAYPPEMEMTERLSSIGTELIVWPEAQAKGYLDKPNIQRAYQQRVSHSSSSVLFQDMQHITDPVNGELIDQYNTAVMLNEQGEHAASYQKIKRIPFGEYVPLLENDSQAMLWAQDFFGAFTSKLSAGTQHQIFEHAKVNIIPLICYETTFPQFVASAVQHGAKSGNPALGNILIALSNDGWFGSTHLPYQHVMSSVLRAVENRTPLIHLANNGPSIVVAPSGKVIFTSDFQQSAGYIVDTPYSNSQSGSFYSRHPHYLTNFIKGLFLLIVIRLLMHKRVFKPSL